MRVVIIEVKEGSCYRSMVYACFEAIEMPKRRKIGYTKEEKERRREEEIKC